MSPVFMPKLLRSVLLKVYTVEGFPGALVLHASCQLGREGRCFDFCPVRGMAGGGG